MSSQARELLRKFTSCDIGDALVKLNYPRGGFLKDIQLRSVDSKTRIFGPAVTVKMVRTKAKGKPTLDTHFVDHNVKGGVMYINQPVDAISACWGGLMSTRAKYLGAEGVVINGRMRDINEHKEFNFPVFSRGVSILGSNTFTRASEINVPICDGGDLWINPGDILVGDADGVVSVPPSLIEQVVALCQERAEIDEKMFAELRNGAAMGDLIRTIRKDK
ncbi:ribonuclease e inhibitor rraa dimethylmenaquinone methyltransferase [Fusarium tjaetaba]|uniref:Ribonuclease e inhibitor rraa dimethylmenaquinone methyltransferase n=1 Tax=Fusarium tjaetaba TaxID=1567544 RepID=A0A8H5RBF9_9HYPO|nr:ribonuclease e inhibitor rraa dimethylmenaquinone methyltransferase [Fusarium tjaetaba]KAF5629803.1 ribonuclease e inhibitor rraa dimethylmenaquinone methyltransferase [Fusarium tjaetaba]